MPKNLTPQDQWETDFQVPIPGEPRNIGPLELLFQRLLNRTERLKGRIAEILGLPWNAAPPDTLSGLHSRVQTLEDAQGGTTLSAHRTAPVLDHPDRSVTAIKLASGAAAANMQGTDQQWGALNWDALTAPGWYRITSGGTGGSGTPPPSPVQEGFLAVMRGNGGAVTQMFIPKGGNYLTPFTRQLDAGVWTAWAGRISALTTNSPLGGDYIVADRPGGTAYKLPLIGSGGVIEYGSNSNGSYIRFADGTQICWASHDPQSFGSMLTGLDINYKHKTKTWVFPVAFITTPVVTTGGDVAGARVDVINAHSATTTQCALEAGQYNTTAVDVTAFYTLAIGRWK
ncbi:pyocin knob domain-containing protein [Thermus brockianus]